MAGQRVALEGRGSGSAPAVVVEVSAAGRRIDRIEAPLRRDGTGARFEASFQAARPGRYLIEVATEGQPPASATVHAVAARARRGSRGMGVKLLQRGLRSLGYATSVGSRYDAATARAVLAYRKVNRMARRTSAGRRVMSRVMAGQGAFRPRYPNGGRHVEFDFSRQVLALVRAGRVERVYHASSGKASTPTVFGTFRFYRKQPGRNAKGMVHSNYFIRGYAIHGFRSVPSHPASHGCIRVPIPSARSISRWISLGDRIYVYR
jgi:lipoprotein-anchoring transpeptidase ErfK/SrfK